MHSASLASFDPSNEGERLRRYQFALQRALLRTLDTLAKLRGQEAKLREAAAKAEENAANEAKCPTPNEPNPEAVIPERRADCRPNEPNSTRSGRLSGGSVTKQKVVATLDQLPFDLDFFPRGSTSGGLLDVSCLRS